MVKLIWFNQHLGRLGKWRCVYFCFWAKIESSICQLSPLSWSHPAPHTGDPSLVHGLMSHYLIRVLSAVSIRPAGPAVVDGSKVQMALRWEKLRFLLSLHHKHITQESRSQQQLLPWRIMRYYSELSAFYRNKSHSILMIYHLSRNGLIPRWLLAISSQTIWHSALFILFGSTECCLLNRPLQEMIAFVLANPFFKILLNLQSFPCGMTNAG